VSYPFDIDISEGVVSFKLENKPEFVCLIDVVDFRRLVAGTKCWYIHTKKANYAEPYIRRTLWPCGTNSHLHREILGAGDFCPKSSHVDHINRNSLDNRRINLREVSARINANNSDRIQNFGTIVYRGLSLTSVRNNTFYQTYDVKKYIAGAKTIESLKKKIDLYLDNKKEIK